MGRERPRPLEEGCVDLGVIGNPPDDRAVWEAWAAAYVSLCRRIADDAQGDPGRYGPATTNTLRALIDTLRAHAELEPGDGWVDAAAAPEPQMPSEPAGFEPSMILEPGARIALQLPSGACVDRIVRRMTPNGVGTFDLELGELTQPGAE